MILKFKDFFNESLNEGKTANDYGLSSKFDFALADLSDNKFNEKGITALAKKHKEDPKKAIEYAKTAFKWLWKESVNEGQMDWEDFGPDEIADKFAKDNAKNADGGDLENWLDMFAMDVGIEDRFHDSFVEEIIDALNSKGYRKIKIEDVDV